MTVDTVKNVVIAATDIDIAIPNTAPADGTGIQIALVSRVQFG